MRKKPPDNETWNTCPECYKYWKDEITVLGLLHRTKLCDSCIRKHALMQPEDLDE